MSRSDLAAALLAADATRALHVQLGVRSVLSDFSAVAPLETEPAPINWAHALSIASALAGEDNEGAQEFALRVAHGCLASAETLEHQREAAAILLELMGNRPSLRLAEQRDQVVEDAWTDAPAPLQLDVIRKRLELGIPLKGGGTIAANPFQRRFWSAVLEADWVSVSAPTSAGKSYIVRQWFGERMAGQDRFTGIYVVPTRALIEEVSADLRMQFADAGVGIYSIPWDQAIEEDVRKILVLTQERLHLLQHRLPTLSTNLLFVDEAQKFGDPERGVLLQQTVEEVVRRTPGVQVVFASPLTSNPEILLEGAAEQNHSSVVQSETITVNQNLLWADQVPRRPTRWQLQLVVGGEPYTTGEFDLPARPQPPSKRLPFVAVALGGMQGGNVIYVNGAAEAESAALQVYDTLGPTSDALDDEGIRDLVDLVQRTVHSQYLLATVLGRRIAFHYGNMPQLVRSEIENLFRKGSLRYLICTSTLLEGVNLPCRNLFARSPQKGPGNPMTAADFWNLAGRAGRWGKEFQGNIVCVDAHQPDRWPELPTVRERQPVTRATRRALEHVATVLDYIRTGAPTAVAKESPFLEHVYSYLATRTLSGSGLNGLPELSAADAAALEAAIQTAHEGIEIPRSMVFRHAGISPAAMQRLLDRFRTYADPEELVLALPESNDALDTYIRALALCDSDLGAGFGTPLRHYALALLITHWMRGYPLARLIASRVNWLRRKKRPYKLANEIRGVMRDVEQVARFKAPKYLACYADIFSLHLQQLGRSDLEGGPDLSMMLELGVSRTTEVSLMALGLSRTSAISLSEFITDDSLSKEQARQWVLDHPDARRALPALIQKEISAVLGVETASE
jgi:hypothetical protein